MPNLILDALPDTFQGVAFNSDFRAVLEFFRLLESKEDETIKAQKVALLFFPEGVPEDKDVWPFIESFINCGEDGGGGEKVFDFDVDGSRLYVSFLQAYGIDLRKEKLHWWIFIELFKGLPEDTIVKRVIDLRAKKPGKNDSDEYRRALLKAQDAYRLETPNLGALFGG
jgi:hypothetical protein